MAAVTLEDVKSYLNITRTTDDSELTDFLDTATSAVEDVIGPIGARTVVEQIDSHGPSIVLQQTPVQSVTSVSIEPWLGATAVDDTLAWRLNPATGVLRRKVVGGSLPFYGLGSIFTVTYTVGRSTVPMPIRQAILMQVRDMWTSQRGSMPLPAGGDNPPPSYGGDVGFLSPSVMEMLLPYLLPPGAA